MGNKSVIGLLGAAFALLLWACGDGAIDAMSDDEILMVTKFPSTLDDAYLDSIVNVCKNDEQCWADALESGKKYTGDYKAKSSDSKSDNDEDDIVWSSGSKLPLFSSSRKEDGDEEDEEIWSSSSKKKRSSSSGATDDDEDYDDDEDDDLSSSSKAKSSSSFDRGRSSSSVVVFSSVTVLEESSSSKKSSASQSSSSLNRERSSSSAVVFSSVTVLEESSSSKKSSASQSSSSLNRERSSSSAVVFSSVTVLEESSSSKKSSASQSSSSLNRERSSSSAVVFSSVTVLEESSSSKKSSASQSSSSLDRTRSSSSKINIEMSSMVVSSSSVPSSSSVKQSSSSKAKSSSSKAPDPISDDLCEANSLVGKCTVSQNPGYKNKPVTWTFTPDATNKCNIPTNIEWRDYSTGGQVEYKEGGYTFTQVYSSMGDKKELVFFMGGQRIQCDPVTIKGDCNTPNTYSCTRKLNSTSANLWRAGGSVSYTWEVKQVGGCYDVISKSWSGAVSGTGNSVTKSFTSASTESVSVTVVDENKENVVSCDAADVYYEQVVTPTCAVSDMKMPVDYPITITPSSVTGCSYKDEACSYVVTKDKASVATGSNYKSGSINVATGSSSEGPFNYSLKLTNSAGSATCDFEVTYVSTESVDITSTKIAFTAGQAYLLHLPSSDARNNFSCTVSSTTTSNRVVGTFDGKPLTISAWNSSGSVGHSGAGSTSLFFVADDAPSDMTCGLSW